MKMRLVQIQCRIASGDYFFIQGTSWYARIIRINTGYNLTHIGIAVWVDFKNGTEPRLCILEAITGQGVRLYPMDRYLQECKRLRERVFWYKLHPSVNRDAVVQYAVLHLGKRYASAWQMVYSFGWLTKGLKKLLGWKDKDLDRNRFFCSELGAGAGKFAGVDTKLPASQSPGELAKSWWLIEQGEVTL